MTTTPGKYWILCAALAAGFVTVPASAMGMGQASGTNQGNGGALYSGIGPSATRPAEFLAQFVELTQADLAANAAMLTSLGLAEDAGRAAAQAAAFTVETTPGKIEAAAGAAAAAHQLVLSKLAGSAVMTAENQAKFAAGALGMAQATRGYSALTGDFAAVKKALVDVGANGRLALFAAKTVPATVAGLRQELQAVVQFAKANNTALAAEVYETAAAP